jgi:hypothetical protein
MKLTLHSVTGNPNYSVCSHLVIGRDGNSRFEPNRAQVPLYVQDKTMSTLPRSPSKIVYPADGSLDHAEDAHKGVIATGVGSPLTTPDEAADESKGDQQPDSPTNDQSESPPSQSDEPLPTAEFTTEAEASIAREEQQATDGLAGNVTDLPPPPPTDPAAPTENPFEEILARAQESKLTATTAYQKADYATARQNYLISLELLQVSFGFG